jgi:hypothetical protein
MEAVVQYCAAPPASSCDLCFASLSPIVITIMHYNTVAEADMLLLLLRPWQLMSICR